MNTRYDETAVDARDLVQRRVLEPLRRRNPDIKLWVAWELASLIEGHFHRVVDVASLAIKERREWERRVTASANGMGNPLKGEFRRIYWLLDDGERVGTFAVDRNWLGRPFMGISSLYIRPDRRSRGIAAHALDAAEKAAQDVGLEGIRLETRWCWQSAVRFYLQRRFWVSSWKHSLSFVRSSRLPDYHVAFEDSRAHFAVNLPDGNAVLLEAKKRGNALVWAELPECEQLCESHPETCYRALSTFALHLAVRGWPLIRSDEYWSRRWDWCDLGMPEGLACKIALFEHEASEAGYDVRTPRIPGLDYRADLDAETA